MHSTSTTDVDPVGTAGRLLRTAGVFVMPSADVNRCLRADAQVWSRFSAHWDDLVRDRYAAELGTQRLRRYGWFSLRRSDGVVSAMPFTCMPGTISHAIMKLVQKNEGGFPFINMVYDGTEQSNTVTRLQAFMHQAREYSKRIRTPSH